MTRRTGLATMLASGTSSQVGAAAGTHAFAALGPAGVVAVRQLVAAAVLLPAARPPLRRMTWAQWWPVLLLAAVFAVMNLSLYTAVDRIGLGLAVTLEFLGPLAVALLGSRTRRDLLTAVVAGAGVYLLVLPGPSSDLLGIGLGATAGACWAAYIVLNRVAGSRLPGLQAPAVATGLSALAYLPVLVGLVALDRVGAVPLLYAVAAGVLSSVVPYAADLTALRSVPQRLFGVVMSVHPVMAALAGVVLLGQLLALHEWLGIAVVVLANVAAVTRQTGGVPVEFEPEVVAAVCRHMDEDHPDDALLIVRTLGARPGATGARTTGVDGAGIRFEADGEQVVVPFEREISTRPEIREQVVVLHRRAAEAAGLPQR